MTTATLHLQRAQKNIQARVKAVDLPSVNWKVFCFIGFFASLFLLVFYVWQINDLTRGSYTINSYNKQINKLSEENKNLQVTYAESSVLSQALAKVQALNFEKTTSVKYIKISENSVATIQR